MLIAIISDTHLMGGRRGLPPACVERIRQADLFLHAGDIATEEAFDELQAIGPPVVAVWGNVDSPALRRRLPRERVVEAAGARIGMVHDAGPARGRLDRLRHSFPDAHAVIFGHSHMPLHEECAGFQIFNPGSPTQRRRAPWHSMGLAHAEQGRMSFELVRLEPGAGR